MIIHGERTIVKGRHKLVSIILVHFIVHNFEINLMHYFKKRMNTFVT